MPSQNTLYSEMEQVLDMLIQTTKQLKEGAQHIATETELELLQQKQQELLGKAIELDHRIKQDGRLPEKFEQERQKIYQRLAEFQHINQEFIAHMTDHKRVIQKKELSSEIKKMISESSSETI